MNTILLSFANSSKAPLDTLSEEDREVHALFTEKTIQEKEFHIQRYSNATLRELVYSIDINRNQLTLFLFSGHADRDRLITVDEEANSEGIAAMLGECPNLKLVILNGCSTRGQVADLLAAGVPCVIATSAPINDATATQFSIAFFTAMIKKGKSIEKAFEDALLKAKTFSNGSIESERGVINRKEKQENIPLWGIFHKEGENIHLQWTLTPEPIVDQSFIPNKLLLEKTWTAIQPHIKEAKDNYSENDKMDKIITKLPHPISEYLRRLISKPLPSEKEKIFYNELSKERFNYLIDTYAICIELIAFILIAQIWDEMSKGNLKQVPAQLKDSLKELFSLQNDERSAYNFIPLIQQMGQLLQQENSPFFINEYQSLLQALQENTNLIDACSSIEKIKEENYLDDKLPDPIAKQLCIEVEKKLSILLSHLGFFAKYSLTSMKDIHFLKLKHQLNPNYQLNYVELRFRPSGMNIEQKINSAFMDNKSVMLLKEEEGSISYLNLSPFIIDENSYNNKAPLADLCFYQTFEKAPKVFTFRYIYKTTRPLVLRDDKEYYGTIADQLNALHLLLFNEKLIDYDQAAA